MSVRKDIWELSSEYERLMLVDGDGAYRDALHEHIDSIPWLSLPPGYSFKPIFPFRGAMARFLVSKDDVPGRQVSVYLDAHNMLGFMFGPYWEACPIGDDIGRWPIEDGKGLIDAIVKQLSSNNTDGSNGDS